MISSESEREIVDRETYGRAVAHFRASGVLLPTFSELAEPGLLPTGVREALARVGPDEPDAANLFRVHWFNGPDRTGRVEVPGHLVLPRALTGVEAPILLALGDRFPMIGAHKVLAAYACLVPRLVTGRFDPRRQRAVWPSTGNYCRGGVAIARALGCRSVAVLPEGMSAERFRWLERWVADPADIVRTPGSESNVREIYEACDELARDPANVILNQFRELANHLVHVTCTGPALEAVFEAWRAEHPGARLAAFVSATGSAGTIGAGDWLAERHGTLVGAVEALECPTMLYNGYGEHNIQGIGDKHVPFVHNVMGTDLVAAVSDRSTDRLHVLFQTPVGREWLVRRGVAPELVEGFAHVGLSGLCNVLAAIQTAKALDLGPDDAIVTVATDGAALYGSELKKVLARDFAGGFDAAAAERVFHEHLEGAEPEHFLRLGPRDRDRIFNLGYFTWVEQRGEPLESFEARRDPAWWRRLRDLPPLWDGLIDEFNARTGLARDVP